MSDDTPVMYVNVTGVALDAQTADAIRDAIADVLSGDHFRERAAAAEAAIKRVRELHRPTTGFNGYLWCSAHCESTADGDPTDYPCATIRALVGDA